jgi:hypothetical protein
LEENPPIGITADKLTDIPSMQALVNGAYANLRSFTAYQNMIASAIIRDVEIRRDPNWRPFFNWNDVGLPNTFTDNMYFEGYKTLNKLNTIADANIGDLIGTDSEKNAILGDMHFLRALVYFDLNNYFALESSGNSVPLVLTVLGVNDKVSVSPAEAIKNQIESDIELARTYFKNDSGISNYDVATALAARIYFYHENYDLAYQRASEVIASSRFSLESDLLSPFTIGNGSSEVIFSVIFNAAEGWPGAAQINFQSFQASKELGITSLNPAGILAELRNEDAEDLRHQQWYSSDEELTYANGKFPNNRMDYIYMRYAEVLLIRAESHIRSANAVSTEDISDVNEIKNRAGASDLIVGTPDVTAMLEIIYRERSKELAFEHGDRFLNTRRLKKGILDVSGIGEIPYSEYVNRLVFPFPISEVQIHDLKR